MKIKDGPLISVIIPVYNVEKYLGRCLDSVLNQSYENLEIILVDDGSTDASGSICDEYSETNDRIKVIHKQNGGLSSARNTGLDRMTGEYLAFIDSDDVIHRNMIKDMLSVIRENEAQFAVCGFQEFYSEEIPDIDREQKLKYKIVDKDSALLMYDGCFGSVMISACNKLYQKSLFDGVRFPEGRKCEDLATVYKIIFAAHKVAVVENAYYYYFIRQNSIMHSAKSPTEYSLLGFDEFIQYCKENIKDEIFKEKMVSMLVKRKADTVLEDYYYSVKRKCDKSDLKHIKEMYYKIRPQLKEKGVLRPQYRVFELNPLLFCLCVEVYYRFIGRNRE